MVGILEAGEPPILGTWALWVRVLAICLALKICRSFLGSVNNILTKNILFGLCSKCPDRQTMPNPNGDVMFEVQEWKLIIQSLLSGPGGNGRQAGGVSGSLSQHGSFKKSRALIETPKSRAQALTTRTPRRRTPKLQKQPYQGIPEIMCPGIPLLLMWSLGPLGRKQGQRERMFGHLSLRPSPLAQLAE